MVKALDRERMIPDLGAMTDAALRMGTDRKIIGVVTYDEPLVVVAAQVAEALGVCG